MTLARIVVLACLVPVAAAAPAADRKDHGETNLTVSAQQVLHPSLLRGRDFEVQETVPVEDGRYHFTLETPWGEIPADGRAMLQVRIAEVNAIRNAKAMSKESQEMEGVKDSLKKTGKGLESLLKDPGGTIKDIPRGIGRSVKSMTDKNTRRAGGDTRRGIAVAVGCDPETENPVLDKLLDELSLRRKIGSGLVSVAGFAATGGVATAVRGASALRTTAEMQETLRTTPIYKINENIRDELVRLRAPREKVELFVEHKAFTTLQRLLFAEQYRQLAGVRDAFLLVDLALEARSQEDALELISAMSVLGEVRRRSPLATLVVAEWPAARREDGSVVIVSPLDHTMLTPEFKRQIGGLREAYADAAIYYLATGRIAPDAAEALLGLRIQPVENAQLEQLP